MLYEFLLEPHLLLEATNTPRNYSDFIKRFSIGAPAVVSDFPKMKLFRKQVLGRLNDDMPELQKSRVGDVLRFLSDTPRVKRCDHYDDQLDWKSNVVSENARIKFDVIVCTESKVNAGEISLDDLHCGYPDYPRQLVVQRAAPEMSAAIQNMLRLSSKIVFVDPYFCAGDSSWGPFINFLQSSIEGQPGENLDIEVLFRKGMKGISFDMENKFREAHADLLRECSVTFKKIRQRVKQQNIHNRYVLTDIGGVTFGVGLSEEDVSTTDEVTLLEKEAYDLRWQQYVELTEFDVTEEAVCKLYM
jgi:hypothetical protein